MPLSRPLLPYATILGNCIEQVRDLDVAVRRKTAASAGANLKLMTVPDIEIVEAIDSAVSAAHKLIDLVGQRAAADQISAARTAARWQFEVLLTRLHSAKPSRVAIAMGEGW